MVFTAIKGALISAFRPELLVERTMTEDCNSRRIFKSPLPPGMSLVGTVFDPTVNIFLQCDDGLDLPYDDNCPQSNIKSPLPPGMSLAGTVFDPKVNIFLQCDDGLDLPYDDYYPQSILKKSGTTSPTKKVTFASEVVVFTFERSKTIT